MGDTNGSIHGELAVGKSQSLLRNDAFRTTVAFQDGRIVEQTQKTFLIIS